MQCKEHATSRCLFLPHKPLNYVLDALLPRSTLYPWTASPSETHKGEERRREDPPSVIIHRARQGKVGESKIKGQRGEMKLREKLEGEGGREGVLVLSGGDTTSLAHKEMLMDQWAN